MAKRMEKTAASPVKVKQEPVEQKVEKLRLTRDKLNGAIELSDDKYDPMANFTGIVNLVTTVSSLKLAGTSYTGQQSSHSKPSTTRQSRHCKPSLQVVMTGTGAAGIETSGAVTKTSVTCGLGQGNNKNVNMVLNKIVWVVFLRKPRHSAILQKILLDLLRIICEERLYSTLELTNWVKYLVLGDMEGFKILGNFLAAERAAQ